jgi:hypothetical protein
MRRLLFRPFGRVASYTCPIQRTRLHRIRRYATDTSALFSALAEVSNFDIKLKHIPSVVMIGDQSSGKTTVVTEVFTGSHNIFPRSMKMATMKPMHITTIRSQETKFKINDKEFKTEQQAADEITRLNNNNIVQIVNVIIFSPKVFNLHFVDTPGVFVVTNKNNSEMPKKIKEILANYLQDPNNILTLIHSSPSDVATDHAFKFIKKYQRENDTIGVLSKSDLLEGKQNIEFIHKLMRGDSEEEFILGHGWVPVCLRSDKDIAANVTPEEKAKSEKELFMRMGLKPSGSETLKKIVSEIQFSKIKDQIPNIIKDIDAQIENLKISQTFLHDLITNDQKKLAGRLSEMVEKLSRGSSDRKEFESCLKKEFTDIIGKYLDDTIDSKKNRIPEFVPATFDKTIFTFHHQHQTKPQNFKIDGIKELFSYGPLPLYTDTPTVDGLIKNEQQLAACLNMIAPVVDDPNNIKKVRWNKYLNAYFSKLLADDTIHKIIYDITKDSLLQFINSDVIDNDEITKKFAEYMIDEISSTAFESHIKYSITAILSLEMRPDISYYELVRYIAQMYPTLFTFSGKTFELFTHENKKLKLEVYGDDWNEAYLKCVARNIANNSYRNVAVNLLDKMIRMLMEMTMDLFNKEQAIKEQKKVKEKMDKLTELRSIISSFLLHRKSNQDEGFNVTINVEKLKDVQDAIVVTEQPPSSKKKSKH